MSKLDAKHYEDNSLFQKSIAKEVLDLYPIHGNENILGVGCGDGFITANMAELVHCGSVTGIDPSIDMIRHAEIKYPQKKYLNLNFKIGMAESEHCHDSYTLITAFNCLHWSHDLPKAFNNIYHSLNKGWRFIGVLYPLESIYWTVFVETLSKPKWNKYIEIDKLKHILIHQIIVVYSLKQTLKLLHLYSDAYLLFSLARHQIHVLNAHHN